MSRGSLTEGVITDSVIVQMSKRGELPELEWVACVVDRLSHDPSDCASWFGCWRGWMLLSSVAMSGDLDLVKSATLRASTINGTPAHEAGGATDFIECCGYEEHWSSLRFLTHSSWLRLALYVEECFQVNNVFEIFSHASIKAFVGLK